jgi:hypothetical protein
MPYSKQVNQNKESSMTPDFDVGDEVELLTWRVFGTKGTITCAQSSPFRHPFHVRTDLGYTVGVYPHEIRHLGAATQTAGEEQPAQPMGNKDDKLRRRG